MDVQYQRCAGLDVHKRTVVACVRLTTAEGDVQQEVRTFGTFGTFGTMTADLLALPRLAGRLRGRASGHGEHRRLLGHLLGRLLAPGVQPAGGPPRGGAGGRAGQPAAHAGGARAQDRRQRRAGWLADLLAHGLAHGLLQPSFIPPPPVRALRELVGYRRSLVQARTQEINRVHQLLELGNMKLAAVATDVLGKSGRAMLNERVAGDHDPEALAELARGRLRAKLPALRQALEGHLPHQQPHHRLLVRQMLAQLDFLEASLAEVQTEIERHLVPFLEAVALAQTLPGVGMVAAAGLIPG